MLTCQALAVCWYATAGHHPADTEARRLDAPWYTSKTEPSTADMTAKLRRVIIAAKFKRVCPDRGCRVTTAWRYPSEIWIHRMGLDASFLTEEFPQVGPVTPARCTSFQWSGRALPGCLPRRPDAGA